MAEDRLGYERHSSCDIKIVTFRHSQVSYCVAACCHDCWERPQRRALVLCLAITAAFALNFTPLTGRVVDQANIISAQSRSDLETKLKDLEDKSGIQLVVATVSSLQSSDVETYANELFRTWKLAS